VSDGLRYLVPLVLAAFLACFTDTVNLTIIGSASRLGTKSQLVPATFGTWRRQCLPASVALYLPVYRIGGSWQRKPLRLPLTAPDFDKLSEVVAPAPLS